VTSFLRHTSDVLAQSRAKTVQEESVQERIHRAVGVEQNKSDSGDVEIRVVERACPAAGLPEQDRVVGQHAESETDNESDQQTYELSPGDQGRTDLA